MFNYTFIIPHHNTPHLLSRLINSIPQRNDIEIIVVDDNSDADKKPVIERPDVKVILLPKEESKWAGHARNVGKKEAKGKWLLFADSDDFYTEGFIDVLDKYRDAEIDILYFDAKSVNSDTLKPANRNEKLNRIIADYDGSKHRIDEVKYGIRAPWNKMISRQFVEQNRIDFEEIIKGNDVQFSYVAGYLAQKIAVEKTKIYVITYSQQSMSFIKKKKISSYLCSVEMMYKLNNFYEFINHPEWKYYRNVFRWTMNVIMNQGIIDGVGFLASYLKSITNIRSKSNRYIELVKERL